MHAGVIIACTTAVSDCRCSSRAVLTCAWTAQTSGLGVSSPHTSTTGLLQSQGFQALFVLGRSCPVDHTLELHACSMRHEPAPVGVHLLVCDNEEADGNIWMVLCREFCNKELKWHPAVFLKQVSHFTRYSISLLLCIINWEAFPCGWCIFPQMMCCVNVSLGGTLISFHHFARNPPNLLRKPKLFKDNWGVSLVFAARGNVKTHGARSSCPLHSCHVLRHERPWGHFSASADSSSAALSAVTACCSQGSSHTSGLSSGLRAGFAIPYHQDGKELLGLHRVLSSHPLSCWSPYAQLKNQLPCLTLSCPLYFDHVREFSISF